jgi:hypothetical protein
MRAYELYWEDKEENEHFLGILPERRKNPERITDESILNWGRMILGEWVRFNKITFNVIELCPSDFSLDATSLDSG